jgi:hypothetical protein
MKDEELTPLKQPEFQMKVTDYAFGSKPQPKTEVRVAPKKSKAQPTLEPVEL